MRIAVPLRTGGPNLGLGGESNTQTMWAWQFGILIPYAGWVVKQ
jgi:hypothetical protein